MPKEAFAREKSHFTVLLTSPDSNVILVNALREAARSAEINLKIVACDRCPRKSPASLLSDAAYELPPSRDSNYLQAIIDVCVVHRVDLILPLASLDVALLTRNQRSFEAIGAAVAVCGKPLLLAASRWSRSARARRRLMVECDPSAVGVEPKARFRVVLYFDRKGELQTIIPCELLLDQGVEHLVTRRDPRVISSIRSKLSAIRSAQSIVTLDALLDERGELMIEHARLDFADTIEIAHKAGAQLVRWLLQEHAGLDASPNDDWREGVEMLRYSAAMYLLPT